MQLLLIIKSSVQKSTQHSKQHRVSQWLSCGIFRDEELSTSALLIQEPCKALYRRVKLSREILLLSCLSSSCHGPCHPLFVFSRACDSHGHLGQDRTRRDCPHLGRAEETKKDSLSWHFLFETMTSSLPLGVCLSMMSHIPRFPHSPLLQYVQGIQEIQKQMVLGLQNNPLDPHIIRKP
jgi:hypothetical protein